MTKSKKITCKTFMCELNSLFRKINFRKLPQNSGKSWRFLLGKFLKWINKFWLRKMNLFLWLPIGKYLDSLLWGTFPVINKSEKILNNIFISRSKIRVNLKSSCLNTTIVTIMAAARYNYNNGSHTRRTCHV